jgi:hypothetical protein
VVGETGACLDTAADLVDVADQATILVLPCRTGAGRVRGLGPGRSAPRSTPGGVVSGGAGGGV